ncbi:MAG: TetR/AcrR family transcriptional regulator [Lachnospiraceae bacterium]|nr:TetR/AcrR family transcriptional regulator [Lachnospiraceae bacterium]
MKNNKTKELLLTTATDLFMEKGYEATGIRDILNVSGVSTGSFYHFFESKEAIFEAVVARYLQGYSERIGVIFTDDKLTFSKRIDLFFDEFKKTAGDYYNKLQAANIHAALRLILHEKTIELIYPYILKMLDSGLEKKQIEFKLALGSRELAAVLLKGIEGLIATADLSTASDKDLLQLKLNIREYINLLINIEK